ncbi:Crp/Fnr family transcriptional regulator [Vallitalea sediminicola]
MEEHILKLKHCELFSEFTVQEIEFLLKDINYNIKKYSKDEIIALEGEEANEVGIVLSGTLTINKLYQDGKQMNVRQMLSGHLLGFALVFSESKYFPSTLIAGGDTTIIFINHKDIIDLCFTNKIFLSNYLKIISDQLVYLSDKIKLINYSTIRKKVINYLLKEYNNQKNLLIKLSVSRKEMAETLGVSRPALSNEMINMKKDGLIKYDNNIIEILDIIKLKSDL